MSSTSTDNERFLIDWEAPVEVLEALISTSPASFSASTIPIDLKPMVQVEETLGANPPAPDVVASRVLVAKAPAATLASKIPADVLEIILLMAVTPDTDFTPDFMAAPHRSNSSLQALAHGCLGKRALFELYYRLSMQRAARYRQVGHPSFQRQTAGGNNERSPYCVEGWYFATPSCRYPGGATTPGLPSSGDTRLES
ncbi:hypothetical protein BDV98DRAFT_49005 [Pterulicium gracile]|uniref:Uncharacterized protein n=1 Tax=Pterulicium gracile TaxID=1884261 RepID=A0A5C3QNF7_9AGAR|nr:hypothetical protein BDV98DRAFT_49005 [Pterula gracilis]